jgi:hypothetical protein
MAYNYLKFIKIVDIFRKFSLTSIIREDSIQKINEPENEK